MNERELRVGSSRRGESIEGLYKACKGWLKGIYQVSQAYVFKVPP